MKTVAICFLVLFLAIAANAQQQQQTKSETDPEAIFMHPWFHPHPFLHEHHRFPFPHPHFHPHFHFPGFPFPYAAQPPTSPSTSTGDSDNTEDLDGLLKFPFHPHLKFPYHPHHMATKEQRECFMAVHDKKMGACLHDLHHYIMTRNVKLGSQCCGALEKIEDACQPLVKHPLPILEGIITHHCSASAPSPST